MIIVLRMAAPGGAAFSYDGVGNLLFLPRKKEYIRKRWKKIVGAGKETP